MSLPPRAEDAQGARSAFFIGPEPEEEEQEQQEEQEEEDRHPPVLQRASALVSYTRLREAIDLYAAALRCGPAQPEQLRALVDCVLRNYKGNAAARGLQEEEEEEEEESRAEDMFDCPGCRRFLAEPVTLACGHSYCRRCLRRRLLSKCRRCGAAVGGAHKANVTLSALLVKWFPHERRRARALGELDELCRRRRFHEAVARATEVIQRGECVPVHCAPSLSRNRHRGEETRAPGAGCDGAGLSGVGTDPVTRYQPVAVESYRSSLELLMKRPQLSMRDALHVA